ncbi:FecR family protein [Chitinophaga sp. NPDC101104]|uniref:FecR family protein n=1 Tax=Chitinophaga sp. NPDC101104 TaxID=3390561 RepID=UPI003CFF284E
MQNIQRITYLVERAAARAATDAELDELTAILRDDVSGEATRLVDGLLSAPAGLPQRDAAYWTAMAEGAVDEARGLHEGLEVPQRGKYRWLGWAAAAAVLLAVSIFSWHQRESRQPGHTTAQRQYPGNAQRVTLTMADGSTMELDSTGNQVIQQQGITLHREGTLLQYEGAEEGAVVPGMNTLSTPRGSRFSVRLPDGSRVWLNAASSLRFPSAFSDSARTVEVNGEAFFEVVQDAQRPFRVMVREHMQVDVLGTAFNIRAYASEPQIAATLTEGSIKVIAGNAGAHRLEPGQQARLSPEGDIRIASDVNTREITAWTNGELVFNDVTLEEAAPMLERWFNIDVAIKNPRASGCRFTVSFLKGESVEQVMGIISKYNGINYRITDRKIVIDGSECR